MSRNNNAQFFKENCKPYVHFVDVRRSKRLCSNQEGVLARTIRII